MPSWLRDSKMLSEARREDIFGAVGRVVRGLVGRARHRRGVRRVGDDRGAPRGVPACPRRPGEAPDALLVDGPVNLLRRPDDPEPFAGVVRPVVDGDARCASVAAASVLAKVVRDRIMRDEADHFPAYGFERNKGYPSPLHQTALRGYGPSAIHRRSWAFMERAAVARRPVPGRTQISCVDDRQGQLFTAS